VTLHSCSIDACPASNRKLQCTYRSAALPCRHSRWRDDWQRAKDAWLAVARLLGVYSGV